MNRKILVLIAVVVALAIAGCSSDTGSNETETQSTPAELEVIIEDGDIGDGVMKFVDQDANVVCYIYHDDSNDRVVGGSGGISCLPIGQSPVWE